jgi:hypothetical protein
VQQAHDAMRALVTLATGDFHLADLLGTFEPTAVAKVVTTVRDRLDQLVTARQYLLGKPDYDRQGRQLLDRAI